MSESVDNLTLYNIGAEFEQLDDILDATGGEITADYEAKEALLLEFLTKKVDGCCGYTQYLDDLISNADAQIKKLAAFKDSKRKRLDNFETYIKLCLTKANKESFEGNLYEISIRKPSKKLLLIDDTDVPTDFISSKQVVSIDRAGILKALKAGTLQPTEKMNVVDGKASVNFKLKSNSKRKRRVENETESVESESVSGNAAGTDSDLRAGV